MFSSTQTTYLIPSISTGKIEMTNKRRHPHWDISFLLSLLSDSNQRPRDYKSRAAIKPWRIRKELAVWHFPMWWDAFLLVCIAKERIYFESTKFQCVFLIITHQNPLFRLSQAPFFIFRTDTLSSFTQQQTFSASNICLLKSTSSPSLDCSPLSTCTLHAIRLHDHHPQYYERKETRKERAQKRISQSNLRDPL